MPERTKSNRDYAILTNSELLFEPKRDCSRGDLPTIKAIVQRSMATSSEVAILHNVINQNNILHVALLYHNDVRIIRYLFKRFPSLSAMQNCNGHSALHMAVILHDPNQPYYSGIVQRFRTQYNHLHNSALGAFANAEHRGVRGHEMRFHTSSQSHAVIPFHAMNDDVLQLISQHTLTIDTFLENVYKSTHVLAKACAKIRTKLHKHSTHDVFCPKIMFDAIRLKCDAETIGNIILCNPDALFMLNVSPSANSLNQDGLLLSWALARMECDTPYNLEILRLILRGSAPSALLFRSFGRLTPIENALLHKKKTEIVRVLVAENTLIVNGNDSIL